MRQRMSEKNVAKLARKTGLDIVNVLVRGGTRHRKDLHLRDGTVKHLWPDGEIVDSIPFDPNDDCKDYKR